MVSAIWEGEVVIIAGNTQLEVVITTDDNQLMSPGRLTDSF